MSGLPARNGASIFGGSSPGPDPWWTELAALLFIAATVALLSGRTGVSPGLYCWNPRPAHGDSFDPCFGRMP